MKLSDLKRIDKMNHLSDYTLEKLLCDCSLYKNIVITTRNISFVPADGTREAHAIVSPDVNRLHEIYKEVHPIELPCPACKMDRPFQRSEAYVPVNTKQLKVSEQKLPKSVRLTDPNFDDSIAHNVFNSTPDAGFYMFGVECLADVEPAQYPKYDWNTYYDNCAQKCKAGIFKQGDNFRIDFTCTLDLKHKGFADFILIPAVVEMPDELITYYEKLRKAKETKPDITIEMNAEEQEADKLYTQYKDAIIISKVGQIPALRDMQLFDTVKYRNVLKKIILIIHLQLPYILKEWEQGHFYTLDEY